MAGALVLISGRRAHSRYLRVVRGRDRVVVRVGPLGREEQDITGRHFTAVWVEAPRISRDL